MTHITHLTGRRVNETRRQINALLHALHEYVCQIAVLSWRKNMSWYASHSEYFREESFVPPHRQKLKLKILLKCQTEIGPHNDTRLIIDRSNI